MKRSLLWFKYYLMEAMYFQKLEYGGGGNLMVEYSFQSTEDIEGNLETEDGWCYSRCKQVHKDM